MTGFKKIKLQIKEYVVNKNNPYLTPSDIDRGKWLAGASHCTVRKLMLSGEIPSVKVGTAIRAHYLDVIEYLKQSYQAQNLTGRKQGYEVKKNNDFERKSQNFDKQKDVIKKENNKSGDNHYHTNKKKIRKERKNYYQENKRKIRLQQKIYYQTHKRKLNNVAKQYYSENKDEILEKNKISVRKKSYDKQYYVLNKAKIQQRRKYLYQLKKIDYDR